MAFIGIFILAWVFLLLVIIAACVILFVYIPALIVTILGIVRGVKNKWPRSSIVMVSVAGSITAIITMIILFFVVWIAVHPNAVTPIDDSSSSITNAFLPYLIY